jgi:hypothetical protein
LAAGRVELFEQSASAIESHCGDVLVEREAGDVEGVVLRLAVDQPRVVRASQEPGILARPGAWGLRSRAGVLRR